MSKHHTQESISLEPTITNNQVKIVSLQIRGIARYFNTSLPESIFTDIQSKICKLNKVGQINQLTQIQYNNTIHHLKSIEHVMHQYFWCTSLIEDSLFSSLFAREIDNTNIIYDNKLCVGSNRLARVKNLAKELINLKILKNLY